MRTIITRQFQQLTDSQMVWDLLVDAYQENEVKAPFFEYALTSSWADKRYLHRNRLWLEEGLPVAFVFYESPVTDIYFCLKKGYEELADELIDYAENGMPGRPEEKTLKLNPKQEALIRAAEKRGYHRAYIEEEYVIDLDQSELNYELPAGFHFVDVQNVDMAELARCTWKGFNHEDKGAFENWTADYPGTTWNPQKAYLGIESSSMAPPPHATHDVNVIIANEQGEYVCFSGMWWVPQNQLAYMEPLCTIPAYRHKGLAAAALSRHYHRMKALGAVCMTGGESPFYKSIGYNRKIQEYGYRKTAFKEG